MDQISVQDQYEKLSDIEHILKRPGYMLGSVVLEEKNIPIMDFSSKTEFSINERNVFYIEGLERVYLEILSNAADNARRSKDMKIPVGRIEVTVTKNTISIFNEGKPIPTEWHQKHNMWIPEMIFFNLRAGSNFNDASQSCFGGQFGLGAKLSGIFATNFKLEIANQNDGIFYSQTMKNNFSDLEKATRIPLPKGQTSYTRITWQPDFKRFYCPATAENVHVDRLSEIDEITGKRTQLKAEPLTSNPLHCRKCWEHNNGIANYSKEKEDKGVFNKEFVGIMAKLALDFAFNCSAPVTFTYDPEANGNPSFIRTFEINTIFDLAKAYMPEVVTIKSKPIMYESPMGDTRVIIFDTPYNGRAISFVNGIPTRQGGVHVNAWITGISSRLKAQLEQDSNCKITANDIKKHITIFLAVYVSNPVFSSQTKELLKSPVPKIQIREDDLKTFGSWGAVDAIKSLISNRDKSKIAKATDGKKRKFIAIPHAEDAEWAGTDDSDKCTAYLVEGLSALPFWQSSLIYIKNARKTQGCYPMRGKVLNTRKADVSTLINNKVINEIKEFIGLEEKQDYSTPQGRKKLRYGTIVILTDADVDGIHIKGLLLNYFSRFKGLIESGCVVALLTPVITLTKGQSKLLMYSVSEYEKWRAVEPNHSKWKPEYFKGLGSATKDMIKDAFTTPVKQIFQCTADDKDVLELAFGKTNTNVRKDLYRLLIDLKPVDRKNSQQISNVEDMIYEELILFAMTANRRAIPRMTDGFKDSYGKVLYAASKESYTSWEGVEEFQGTVKKVTKYRHGPESLKGVIVGMAQAFPRSNNVPFLEGQGNFGSRGGLGSDASAPRYIHCRPSQVIEFMFRKEDQPLLIPEYEDGKQTGYKYYLPILPTHLLNYCPGIGWGWSSSALQYNPLDLIEWIRYFIQHIKDGKPVSKFKPPRIFPWWRGYKGIVYRKTSGKLMNRGFFCEEGAHVMVTELPISISGEKYKEFLTDLVNDGKLTAFYPTGVDPNKPEFKLEGLAETHINIKELGLERSLPESGMTFLDENDVPQNYIHGFNEVMACWCKFRYNKYVERKKIYTLKLEEDLRLVQLKLNFVEDIIAEPPRLVISNRTKEEYIPYMEAKGYPQTFLKMSLSSTTKEKADKLRNEAKELQKEVLRYKNSLVGNLWLQDLKELKEFLEKEYPNQWNRPEGYGTKQMPEPPRTIYKY